MDGLFFHSAISKISSYSFGNVRTLSADKMKAAFKSVVAKKLDFIKNDAAKSIAFLKDCLITPAKKYYVFEYSSADKRGLDCLGDLTAGVGQAFWDVLNRLCAQAANLKNTPNGPELKNLLTFHFHFCFFHLYQYHFSFILIC